MPSPLVSAFIGAIIAFAGTYLLQRGQFRRADLEGVRERLGLARALRADLRVAKLSVEIWIREQQIVGGSNLPTALWGSHGHRLIAAVLPPADDLLIDAFGRFGSINGIVSATQRPGGHLPLDGDKLNGVHLQNLVDKIDTAVEILTRLEEEYEAKELRLRHPVRSRFSRD